MGETVCPNDFEIAISIVCKTSSVLIEIVIA